MDIKGHVNLARAKSVLITGAGHGIGLAFVKRFLECNQVGKIFASYLKYEKARELFYLIESR